MDPDDSQLQTLKLSNYHYYERKIQERVGGGGGRPCEMGLKMESTR